MFICLHGLLLKILLCANKNNADLRQAAFIKCCLLKSAYVKGGSIVLGNVKLALFVRKIKGHPRTGHEGPEGE